MDEEVPALLEKRLISSDQVVTVLENGNVLLQQSGGAELALSAESAYELLCVLYDHRDWLYRQCQKRM